MPKQLPAFAKHPDKKPVKSSISHFPVVFAGIPNVKDNWLSSFSRETNQQVKVDEVPSLKTKSYECHLLK